ncbi:hypothetical protein PVL29_013173 [Vitis rotundifolia]|uniref:Uncharacterized protein n=1 Tax=Vitis rotundifolia TaxID=103349 RepID=A0AA38ZKQ5_VITRO|nr:hypothetical protein PVL29_013173 [Vitis rotundifolia]
MERDEGAWVERVAGPDEADGNGEWVSGADFASPSSHWISVVCDRINALFWIDGVRFSHPTCLASSISCFWYKLLWDPPTSASSDSLAVEITFTKVDFN